MVISVASGLRGCELCFSIVINECLVFEQFVNADQRRVDTVCAYMTQVNVQTF